MIHTETMKEFLPDFLDEVASDLAALKADLVRLADTPGDLGSIGRAFRAFHNIKGASGFLGLPRLGRLCHTAENVLGRLRDHRIWPTPDALDALRRCVDAIGDILDTIRLSDNEGPGSDEILISELNILAETGEPAAMEEHRDGLPRSKPLPLPAADSAGTASRPISKAWAILPRIIQGIATKQGKKIEIVMEGADTELDRRVLEMIRVPLIHMSRNAADHGVEAPEVRAALGKPETGLIRLRAFHDGGHAVIEVADDGSGLDYGKIRSKVLQARLAAENELAAMTDATVARFILEPGISTAAEITEISGRGVGLDVVRTNIENLNGAIEIASTPHHGVSFVIRIPLDGSASA